MQAGSRCAVFTEPLAVSTNESDEHNDGVAPPLEERPWIWSLKVMLLGLATYVIPANQGLTSE